MLLRTFFGSTFIEKDKLEEAEIYHPIKLEYYKEINEDDIQKVDKAKYGISAILGNHRRTETYTAD